MDRRIYNACPSCGKQYDVSHLSAGQRVLCECGERFGAKHLRPHAPKALKCSGCGGNLRDGQNFCEYCGAEVTLEERRLDAVCPGCGARMRSDARFCMECGIAIEPQAIHALAESTVCPRCSVHPKGGKKEGELRTRTLSGASVIECGQCGGLWLDHALFERMVERANERAQVRLAAGTRAKAPPVGKLEEKVAYLACPTCGMMMTRRNFARMSGVITDVCKSHGIWLDHEELEKVLEFVRQGGLEESRRRQAERDRLEAERTRQRRTTPTVTRGSDSHWSGFGGIGGEVAVWGLLGVLGELFD